MIAFLIAILMAIPMVVLSPRVTVLASSPTIDDISPMSGTVATFANIPTDGGSFNAYFAVSGSSLDVSTVLGTYDVTSANFYFYNIPSWITLGPIRVTNEALNIFLEVPITIDPNPGNNVRTETIELTNTINNLVSGELIVRQFGLAPVIDFITATADTVNAFNNISSSGAVAQRAEFAVVGANLTTAHFNIASGLPNWIEPSNLSFTSSPTGGVITVDITVLENTTGSTRTQSFIVNNTVTPGVTGVLPISQNAVVTYPVTITNSPAAATIPAGQTPSGNFAPGSNVSVSAGTRVGHSFTGWNVTGITPSPSNLTNNTIAFTMPANAVSLVANWQSNFINVPNVSSIIMSTHFGQVGTPFNLNSIATIVPDTAANGREIIWSFASSQLWDVAPGVIPGSVISGGTLTVLGEGSVRVVATIAYGSGSESFTQTFTLHFSTGAISASVEGIDTLFVGVPVNGRILFTLTDAVFARDIFPSDFFVTGLPLGLRTGDAERISDTEVVIPITGTPGRATNDPTTIYRLTVPAAIPARNVVFGIQPVGISGQASLFLGAVADSAAVLPGSLIFDINPYGSQHRDIPVAVHLRTQDFRGIYYGEVLLREDIDYTRRDQYIGGALYSSTFTLLTSFLSRLPVGEWSLTFSMRQGANPTLTLIVIDTTNDQNIGIPDDTDFAPGEPVLPPSQTPRPDENFMFLTGGTAVDINAINWGTSLARVSPQIMGDRATVTVRTSVLDYLAWLFPNEGFEISTPLSRVDIPLDVLDIIFGARIEIINRGLRYDQVDLRISLIDRTSVSAHENTFRNVHPNGMILSSLVELRMELINAGTGVVFHTAREFTRPVNMTFVVMGTSNIRPAGIFFHPVRPEFAPYRVFRQNEITIRSIFPGVHGVVHNAASFDDIPIGHWGFEQAYTAAYSGIVIASGSLNSDAEITRGEFIQLLANTMQLPRVNVTASGFNDISSSHMFFDGISRANAAGLLGMWNGNLSPNAPITRQEMASIIGAAVLRGTPERSQSPEFTPIAQAFTDSRNISASHLPMMQVVVNYRVLAGFTDGSFRPLQNATRIEALQAVINLARTMGLLDERR